MALHIPCLERLETSLIKDAVLDHTIGDIGAIGFILPNGFPGLFIQPHETLVAGGQHYIFTTHRRT